MKKILLAAMCTLLLASLQSLALAQSPQPRQPQTEDQLWQLDQIQGRQTRPSEPPRQRRSPAGPACPQMENSQLPCPGMAMQGQTAQQRRRSPQQWQPYSDECMSPEYLQQLQEFLAEHEPSLAALLTELKNNEPERYQRSIVTVVSHYGPIMEQMQHDPEIAQINLRKTKLTLEIEQALRTLRNAKNTENDQQLAQATEQLHQKVTSMFNLIMQQQNLQVNRAAERFEAMEQSRTRLDQRMQQHAQPQTLEADHPAPGMMRHGTQNHRQQQQNWQQRRCEEMQQRLDQHRRQSETWSQNAQSIIDARVRELITGGRPFPW